MSNKYRANHLRDGVHPGNKNGQGPKSSNSWKPRDLFSLGSADPLPEGVEMFMTGANANGDHYDTRLIDTVKKSPEGIVIVDKIERVIEPASEMDVSRQPSAEGLPLAK